LNYLISLNKVIPLKSYFIVRGFQGKSLSANRVTSWTF